MDKEAALELALEYVRKGAKVFPVALSWDARKKKVSKYPLTPHSHDSATDNEDELREQFRKAPSHLQYKVREGRLAGDVEYGVGIRPSSLGCTVIDVDINDEVDGYATYAQHNLPETTGSSTPSGGEHNWILVNRPISNAHKLGEGIDVRGDSGWVVAPGTTSQWGNWTWVREDLGFQEMPEDKYNLFNGINARYEAGVTQAQIDQCGPLAYAKLKELGGWGERWQARTDCPSGAEGQIIMTQPGKTNMDQSVFIGWTAYEGIHFNTSNWSTPEGSAKPTFEPGSYNMDQGDIERFIATGSKELKLKQQGPQLVTTARKKTLAELELTLDELEELEAPQYLIDKYLVEGSLSMMYADPGVGKSFVAIDWMMHLAAGIDWQGFKVAKAVPVYYIAAEGQTGLKFRINAWKQEHPGLVLKDIKVLPIAVNLANGDADELLDRLEELRPGLVVIDTLARTSAGADGNSDRDMGIVIANATAIQQRAGSAVLVLHHTGHVEKNRARGSSSLPGAMDTMFQLDGKSPLGGLTLSITKQKDDEEAIPLKIRMRKVTLEKYPNKTSLVLLDPKDDREDVEDEGPSVDPKLLQVIDILWRIQISPQTGRSSTEWKTAVHEELGMAQGTFFTYQKKAMQEGLVVKLGEKKFDPYAAVKDPYEDNKRTVTMNEREVQA